MKVRYGGILAISRDEGHYVLNSSNGVEMNRPR